MDRVRICAECGKLLDTVALVNLVVSYEADDETDELFEQLWHKACYLKYLKRNEERAPSQKEETDENTD